MHHPFIKRCDDTLAPSLPMQYHCFMSHSQADASGTVGTLYLEYKKLGLHNWRDMSQNQLTLEGMKQGVRDSAVLLIVLTKRIQHSA